MLSSALMWTGICLGAVVSIFVLKIFIFNPIWYGYYLFKTIEEFPYMKWLDVESAKKDFGIPRSACRMILPDMLKRNIIEIRIKTDLPKHDSSLARRRGFNRLTVEFYEFRLLVKPPNKRRYSLEELSKPLGDFVPSFPA